MKPETLAKSLDKTAADMRKMYPHLAEYSAKNATQMLGAARIMESWAERLREDIAS